MSDSKRGRPRAARGWIPVEDIDQDWRRAIPRTLRYRMSSRLSAGMPDDMKLAVRLAARKLGVSMSEVVRRLVALGVDA